MSSQQSLSEFMRDMSTRSKIHSHVLLGSPYGIYSIGSRMEEFWSKYIPEVKAENPLYIAETPGRETPVLVDVDLRAKKSILKKDLAPGEHLYSEEQLHEVIEAYQAALKKICMNLKDEALTCVVLEKDPCEQEINGEKYVKNGFHLHFPKCYLERKVQEVYLVPIVKEMVEHTFDNIGAINAIDGNAVNVHWLLYGSHKPNGVPYVATKCYNNNCTPISFEEALGDYILPVANGKGKMIDCHGKVEELLPRILSIFLYGREKHYYYKPEPSVDTPLMEKYENIRIKRKYYDQLSITETMKEATNLVHLLSPSRADDRSDWLSVGFCLWNITEGDDDGLSLWLEFAEQSEKFDEAECIHIWNTMRENKYTIGTLRFFAKQDSPEEYTKLTKTTGKTLLKEAVKGCHNDLAKILYNEHGNEFVCTSITDKTWYQFKNHIWQKVDKGFSLRERISDPNGAIISQLTEIKNNLMIEMADLEADTKEYQAKIKAIRQLIKNCKTSTFKSNVMIECQEVFYNPSFYDLLNKDAYLVAFKNGVYDFTNDIFRDGNPEDYLSVAIPIEYIDYRSSVHPSVMDVDDFFRKVFPDKEVRDYFLDQTCQVFVGGNHDKVMLFWTGEGNNGKTVTQTLFEKMLGKLAIKFSTTLLTGKKTQTGIANPELARAGNGVRWAVMEEPNEDEMISTGTMKALSGNDSYWARDLFESGKQTKEIIPLFKLHMICNKLPKIKNADKATWNRVRVIPFESTFVPEDQCSDNYDDQMNEKKFPMDPQFTDKIPNLIQPLAWYLIQRWRTLNRTARQDPEKVKAATEMYMQDNDVYKQFEDQCVFDKEGAKVSPTTLYGHFKEWYKEEYPGHTLPNRSDVCKHFFAKWGELTKSRHWLNKTCRQPDTSSVEENEIIINPML